MNELLLPEDLPEAVLECAAGDGEPDTYHEAVARAKRRILLDGARAGAKFLFGTLSEPQHPGSELRRRTAIGLSSLSPGLATGSWWTLFPT